MNITEKQQKEIEHGEAVPVTVGKTECILLRRDVYEKVRNLVYDDSDLSDDELRAVFARGIESSDWNDPSMDEYDEYDKHKS